MCRKRARGRRTTPHASDVRACAAMRLGAWALGRFAQFRVESGGFPPWEWGCLAAILAIPTPKYKVCPNCSYHPADFRPAAVSPSPRFPPRNGGAFPLLDQAADHFL